MLTLAQHRDCLRHIVATIAYRGTRVMENLPDDFPEFNAGKGVMTPLQLLGHINMLLHVCTARIKGQDVQKGEIEDWKTEKKRFYKRLAELDDGISTGKTVHVLSLEQLIHGPLLDALTHIGQISMLRRLAGSPIERIGYLKANIRIGRIGPEV